MLRAPRSRRKRLLLLGVALLVIAAAIAWRVFRVNELLDIGTGYAAQQTCACLFISHRTLESCMTDLEPLAQRLLHVSAGQDQVTARGLYFITATARFERGFGCRLDD